MGANTNQMTTDWMLPGIFLPALENRSNDYSLYFLSQNVPERIFIHPNCSQEQFLIALLSIIGLKYEDFEASRACLSICTCNGDKLTGDIPSNTPESAYVLKLNIETNESTVGPLFEQIESISKQLKSMDMDKIQCDASLYSPLLQQTTYVEKYKFTQYVKDSLKLPTFNNWEYEDNELVSLVMLMYVELGIPEHFEIDLQTLYNFVSKVRDNYNNNPFHCFKHGFCVFQMAFSLIHATGLVKDLTMLERLTLMTACLGHDLDHPGYNNAYQVNAKTDLAIIYNDSAPLENHHSAMLFAILNLDSCNLLKTLDHHSFSTTRRGIIRCIMATDMAKHGEHLQIFNKILPVFSTGDAEHRAQLLSIIIKCADISTEVRPPHIADIWVNRLLEEFFCQSDREKLEGLPFLPFMDRDKVTKPGAQVGFLSFVVIPLYEALGKLYPQIEPGFIAPIKKSLDYYKGLQAPPANK